MPDRTLDERIAERAYRQAGRRKEMTRHAIAEYRATFDKSDWWAEMYGSHKPTDDNREEAAIHLVAGMKLQRRIDEELKQE
jgi:hypothetical protein